MGKFRFIEELDNDEKKLPILKIVLYNVIRLAINPSDLPVFLLLINITAVVTEPARNDSDHDDISFSVETRDFMDQDNTVLKLECYHLKLANHLIHTTNSLKKGFILFMNGELLIVDDTYVVHLHDVNFCEYQKAAVNVTNPANLPWLNGPSQSPTNVSSPEKVTRTIASRVKTGRRKKSPTIPKLYLKLKNQPKVTDLAINDLNQDQNSEIQDPSISLK
ncbi:26466_t:CDS:2, partial [Dentiscutata erythropus]